MLMQQYLYKITVYDVSASDARLPVEQLKDMPEPVVVLLEALLEKDPARRFQNPTELLNAIPTVTDALDTGRRITRERLQKTPASRVGTRKPPARLAPDKISIARLPVTGSDVFGRDEDMVFLDRAWAKKEVNVVTIVAWGAWVSFPFLRPRSGLNKRKGAAPEKAAH